MGDQVYAYRSSQYATAYDGVDSDGRHRAVYDCPPIDETYVVETQVTERRRHGSPPYHHRGPASPHHDRRCPQEVGEFLTGVQLEASRHGPRPYSARQGHHGGVGDYRKGNGYSSDEYDSNSGSDDDDDHHQRRRRHHGKPIGGHGKMGMPTSDINEAVEFLKLSGGSSRPYGGSESAHHGHCEVPARQYATKYQVTEGTKVKPYGTTTTTGHTYGTISNSPAKPYGGSVYAGDSRPLYNKYPATAAGYGSEAAKHHGGGGGGYGRPINSGGDGSRYRDTSGNYGASSHQVIDCYEAAKRFNGKVIRT